MDILNFIWLVLPITITIGFVVLIVVIGQVVKTRMSTIGKLSFQKLANELKEDNAKIMADLAVMKEGIDSMDKMMKEIG